MRKPEQPTPSVLTPVNPPVSIQEPEEEEEPQRPKAKKFSVVVAKLPIQEGVRQAADNAGNLYEYFTVEEALGEILDWVRSQKKKSPQ